MATDEIICLSSDDEDSPKLPHQPIKSEVTMTIKKSPLSSHSPTVENESSKRKSSVEEPNSKRIRVNYDQIKATCNNDTMEVIKISPKNDKPSTSSCQVSNGKIADKNIEANKKRVQLKSVNISDVVTDREKHNNALPNFKNIANQSPNNELKKPLLVIREKHPVNIINGNEDVFAMFISQCLQRDRTPDMQKIVSKLKRRYEQLDPIYAMSDEFADLLNEKRDCLMNERGLLFKHIGEVSDEMKCRKLGKCNYADFENQSAQQYSNYREGDEEDNEQPEETEEDSKKAKKRKAQIKKLEKTMEIAQKRIAQYEQEEVNFDDEDDSSFLKLERYKQRMVELHSSWCKCTNNDESAGRSYLMPKHFNKLTGIVTVDQAINSFVNAKLAKRRNFANKQLAVDSVVFPDYVDILNLVHTHNVNNNLGMDNRAERAAAKNAFTKLGEHLQRLRQRDLFDSFSHVYEKDDDPASKSSELLSKLQENRKVGDKKLHEVFEEFSKKQEEAKNNPNAGPVDNNGENAKDEDDEDNDDEEDDDDDDDEGDDEKDVSDAEVMNVSDCESNEDENEEKDDKMDVDEEKESGDEVVHACKAPESEINGDIENLETDKESNDIENNNEVQLNIVTKEENANGKIPEENSSMNTDNKDQVNEVNAEHVDTENTTKEQPLLKLRSFAKASEFWQSSQDVGNAATKDKNVNAQNSSKKSIEVINLDEADEQKVTSPKNANTPQLKDPNTRIVKIINKKVEVKKMKAVIVKNHGLICRKTDSSNAPEMDKNSGQAKNIYILSRIVPPGKNVQSPNVAKPSSSTVENTRKSNENVVQSSTISTTVGKVLNPLAKQHQNGQRVVEKKVLLLRKEML